MVAGVPAADIPRDALSHPLTEDEIRNRRLRQPVSNGRCWYCWAGLPPRHVVKAGREYCDEKCANSRSVDATHA